MLVQFTHSLGDVCSDDDPFYFGLVTVEVNPELQEETGDTNNGQPVAIDPNAPTDSSSTQFRGIAEGDRPAPS